MPPIRYLFRESEPLGINSIENPREKPEFYAGGLQADNPGIAAGFLGGGKSGDSLDFHFGWNYEPNRRPIVASQKGNNSVPLVRMYDYGHEDLGILKANPGRWMVVNREGGGLFSHFAQAAGGVWACQGFSAVPRSVPMCAGLKDDSIHSGIVVDGLRVAQLPEEFTRPFGWSLGDKGEEVKLADFLTLLQISRRPDSGYAYVRIKFREKTHRDYWEVLFRWDKTVVQAIRNGDLAYYLEGPGTAGAPGYYGITALGTRITITNLRDNTEIILARSPIMADADSRLLLNVPQGAVAKIHAISGPVLLDKPAGILEEFTSPREE